MSAPRKMVRLLLIATAALLYGIVPAAPTASAAPVWQFEALTNTTISPGGSSGFTISFLNIGTADTSGQYTLTASLPSGLKATSLTAITETGKEMSCAGTAFPASVVTCKDSETIDPGRLMLFSMSTTASPALPDGTVKVVSFAVSGGGAAAKSTVTPITVASASPGFGLAALDGATRANSSGVPSLQAAAHPYDSSLSFDLATSFRAGPSYGDFWPVDPLRDAVVELPPGLIGNLSATEQCRLTALSGEGLVSSTPLCPSSSQVGTTMLRFRGAGVTGVAQGPLPVFRIEPPPGVVARFGFLILGSPILLNAKLRSSGDYGVTISSFNIPEALPLVGTTTTLWGNPASEEHRGERSCPGESLPWSNGPTCASGLGETAFLRNPTSCLGPEALKATIHADSWVNPGALDASAAPDLSDPAWSRRSYIPHQAPGYPYPPGDWGASVELEGCDEVPFGPAITVQPTTHAADSPTGLSVDMAMPQQGLEEPDAISESDLRAARVQLPAGMSVNPSSAGGLAACSSTQIGLSTAIGASPIHFSAAPASCPDASKIGTVSIATPLLGDNTPGESDLEGSVYLAAQSDNPFNSLLAMYIAVADAKTGIVVKLAGHIVIGPDGRLETVFEENPQTPFSNLHLQLFGGSRAALRTPAACGTYATQATLDPWSGLAPVTVTDSFTIDSGPGGSACPGGTFAPQLFAGTANPLAGAFSRFNLRLTRADGEPELTGLSAKLPKGLIGSLRGVPYCLDATLATISSMLGTGASQIASPSCPIASQVGTVTVGAGAGRNPFFTSSGRAYLAGPYKGAPLSLVVVTPAVAGPFDLGSVVVRNALRIDPETAQLTAASDPLPTVLHGIPLDLRDIRVNIDRSNFTLNPTSCDPMSIDATITGAGEASANLSNRFQVAGCRDLAFKPKLYLRLKGATKRGGNPGLRAVLTMPHGGANIARASVALPHSEFLDQAHIGTICTRVQYAAKQCPARSVYGHATAWSPLLDQPLSGPVYLRSSDHKLPDFVASLDGQIHVDLSGRIDSVNGGIRSTFGLVPDAPVSKFVLTMAGNKKGLLENSTDICAATHRASAKFDGQNGKIHDLRPALKVDCGDKRQG